MIGVFDSGVGGIASYKELRARIPYADIAYLADRKNAPYGTKTQDELKRLVSRDIQRLRGRGATRILIACCTASTVHHLLSPEDRAISVPIISCAAEAFCGTHAGVIATEATVRSHEFARQIGLLRPNAPVSELATQELVSLVERGGRDGSLDAEGAALLDGIATRLRAMGIDTLILGCTHFSHLSGELSGRLPGVEIIDTARVGARRLAEDYINEENKKPSRHISGLGRTIYM